MAVPVPWAPFDFGQQIAEGFEQGQARRMDRERMEMARQAQEAALTMQDRQHREYIRQFNEGLKVREQEFQANTVPLYSIPGQQPPGAASPGIASPSGISAGTSTGPGFSANVGRAATYAPTAVPMPSQVPRVSPHVAEYMGREATMENYTLPDGRSVRVGREQIPELFYQGAAYDRLVKENPMITISDAQAKGTGGAYQPGQQVPLANYVSAFQEEQDRLTQQRGQNIAGQGNEAQLLYAQIARDKFNFEMEELERQRTMRDQTFNFADATADLRSFQSLPLQGGEPRGGLWDSLVGISDAGLRFMGMDVPPHAGSSQGPGDTRSINTYLAQQSGHLQKFKSLSPEVRATVGGQEAQRRIADLDVAAQHIQASSMGKEIKQRLLQEALSLRKFWQDHLPAFDPTLPALQKIGDEALEAGEYGAAVSAYKELRGTP